jgi:GH18 family chitinase
MADFVIEHQFDGIDLDWEDNGAMEAGTGEDWLIKCTLQLRVRLPME